MSAPRPGEKLPAVPLGPLDAAAIARYARASGDDNPVHLDAAAARAIGLADPVAHGMLVMGRLSRLALEWRADAVLESLECRFTRPVPAGSLLSGDGRVAKVDALADGHRVILRLLARDAQGAIAAMGEATLRLPG
ncbi:MAG: MaoC family dehydratase [Alphaproteobacteria bacterium]|nr:MaoC family dehydratase [Alphaproteobacteria bacterium]MCW5738737.1 MaoC family dehydratase [Alphaproteobacteria bacterium]